jgi:hypothetical protein
LSSGSKLLLVEAFLAIAQSLKTGFMAKR